MKAPAAEFLIVIGPADGEPADWAIEPATSERELQQKLNRYDGRNLGIDTVAVYAWDGVDSYVPRVRKKPSRGGLRLAGLYGWPRRR